MACALARVGRALALPPMSARLLRGSAYRLPWSAHSARRSVRPDVPRARLRLLSPRAGSTRARRRLAAGRVVPRSCSGNDLGTSLPPLRPLRLSLCLTRLQRLILGGRLNGCLNRGSGSLYQSGAGGSTCGAEDSLRRSGGSPHFVTRNQGDADGWRCSGCLHPSVAGGWPREPNRPLRQVGGLPQESNRPPRQAGGWCRRSKDSPRRSDCPLPGSDRPTRGPNGSQTGANRPRRLGGGSQTGANRPLQAGGEVQTGANRPLRPGRGT